MGKNWLWFFVLFSILVLAVASCLAQINEPALRAIPAETLLKSDGTIDNNTGVSGAVDMQGWNVTLDSERGPVLTRDNSKLAKPLASTWSALANNGLNTVSTSVRAFAVIGSDLYVGGQFSQTADGTVTNLNNIAKYNTSTNTWSALGNNGLNSAVLVLLVIGSDLYVGGQFSQTADGTVTNLNRMAKYNTLTNTWSAFSNNGLNSNVYDLALMGSDLYVGGDFIQTADGTVTNLNRMAKYNTLTNTWSALSNNGLNSNVRVLTVMGSDLYVGGIFAQTADGTVTNLNRIARYNTLTNTWSALGNNGLNSSGVFALAVIGSDLYAGGVFSQTADGTVTNLNNIARYSGGTWSALANNGLNNSVRGFTVMGSDLYVGGSFTRSADLTVTNLNRIAKYSGGAWSALANNGMNDQVFTLVVTGSDMYVGGFIAQTADGMVTNLNRIAKYEFGTNAPEIDVQRPATTSIVDGGTDNIGNQTVGPVNLIYIIDNSAGTDQLDVTAVTASNMINSSGFSVVSALPLTIPATATAALQVSFNVDAVGAFSFDMDITNNDLDENPYDIQVTGIGLAPTNIALSAFHAEVGQDGILINWATETEADNAGFNIYRRTEGNGSYSKINDSMILAQGDATSGASYSYVDQPEQSGDFYYKLQAVSLDGSTTFHGPVFVGLTSVDLKKYTVSDKYTLSQNHPNPFNPTTEITFALPKAETVKLSIYNTSGQLIRTLANGFYSEGFHTVMWNATDESGSRVTSGMYMYVLQAGEMVLQNKMLLMK